MYYMNDYAEFSNEPSRRRPMPPPPSRYDYPDDTLYYTRDGRPIPPRRSDRYGRPVPPPPEYYRRRPPQRRRDEPNAYAKAKLARSSVSTGTRVSQETRGWARLAKDFMPLFTGS